MPLTSQQQLRRVFDLGYFKHPDHPELWPITAADLPKLNFKHPLAKTALAEFQAFDAHADILAQMTHGRNICPDGKMGPVTVLMLETGRCDVPDWGPLSGLHPWDAEDVEMAVGSGSWARCHGALNHHRAVARVFARLTSHLAAPYRGWRVIDEALLGVSNLYGEIGLEPIWDWEHTIPNHQADIWIDRWSASWLGLAQVPPVGRACNAAPVWARHQNSFRSNSSAASVVAWWIVLLGHEFGHLLGLGHSRGGIMNPTINLIHPATWRGDPFERTLMAMFGGNPVPGHPFHSDHDFDVPSPRPHTVWRNIRHPLEFADGSVEYYDIEIQGPMMPGVGVGASNWNFGKTGPPIPLHILIQPSVTRTEHGKPLAIVV